LAKLGQRKAVDADKKTRTQNVMLECEKNKDKKDRESMYSGTVVVVQNKQSSPGIEAHL